MDMILNAVAGFFTVRGVIALWNGVYTACSDGSPSELWADRGATLVIVALIVWGMLRTVGHL